MQHKTALITGASSGIGETFARRLAARGYDLILIARRGDRLRKLASELPGKSESLVADLATEEGRAKAESAVAACDTLEMLVNNAGFGTMGRLWEIEPASQERMIQVHILATMRLSRAALRIMVPRKSGAIINVSSVAAFSQSAGHINYYASKTWINSFTEGLDLELRAAQSPVKVQALCPGFTITEFHEALGMDRGLVPGWMWMTAEEVVDASLSGLERGNIIVVPGWKYRLAVTLTKIAPKRLTRGARKVAVRKL